MNLEIVVSTLQDGIYELVFLPEFNYLVIHQVPDEKDNDKYYSLVKTLPKNVRYILSNTKGLSISRNIGLKNSIADYIWIMDDDVKISKENLEQIEMTIKNHPNVDMYVINHSHMIPPIKNKLSAFPSFKRINYLSAMSISSIDMIIKRNSVNNIKFDENFGLGTNLPSGEEYIFAIDMLKAKKNIIKVFDIYSHHPEISSGYDFFSSNNKLKAKLEMFCRCYNPILGYILYSFFITKKSRTLLKNKKMADAIKILFQKI